MTVIRPAGPVDLAALVALSMEGAAMRQAADPVLWRLDPAAEEKTAAALRKVLGADHPPMRQHWLLAKIGAEPVAMVQTILLPVPPIYAGAFGPPGLIMESSFLTARASADIALGLIVAAEADLRAAGAKLLLASCVEGGRLAAFYRARGYQPLTLYLSNSTLADALLRPGVRAAGIDDIAGLVSASAENRRCLHMLNAFWEPHPDADGRFDAWMRKSLTLEDRDMFVATGDAGISGYAISQPATPLHFPVPHDIRQTGVIDDWFHADFSNPAKLRDTGGALALLAAAEAALVARETRAALVICPAAWTSKRTLLEAAGYRNALTWYLKSTP